MLAAVRTLVAAHQRAGFIGDGAHFRCAAPPPAVPHVEDRAHVQRAHAGMRVPGAAGAVSANTRSTARCSPAMFQRHRAILDESSPACHRPEAHHDVEPGLAHFPQVLLWRVVGHLHHGTGQASVPIRSTNCESLRLQCIAVIAGELHQQDRVRLAHQRRADRRREGRVGQRARSSCGQPARRPSARVSRCAAPNPSPDGRSGS